MRLFTTFLTRVGVAAPAATATPNPQSPAAPHRHDPDRRDDGGDTRAPELAGIASNADGGRTDGDDSTSGGRSPLATVGRYLAAASVALAIITAIGMQGPQAVADSQRVRPALAGAASGARLSTGLLVAPWVHRAVGHGHRPAAASVVVRPARGDSAAILAARRHVALVRGLRAVAALLPPPAPPNAPSPLGQHPFLVCTRAHESDTAGGYRAISPGGTYRGAYQFLPSTWDNVARHAGRPDLVGVDPAAASPADQDLLAFDLFQWQGSSPWGGRCA